VKLVVVIPCLNEAATIGEVIDAVPSKIDGISEICVIVVDDGSKDDTAAIARNRGAVIERHETNRGVGAAFGTGIDAALGVQADVIVNMDGDGQFNPADIPFLIDPILNQSADFVTCTRFRYPGYQPDMSPLKRWGNRMMCHIINHIIPQGPFSDVSCGFRAYSRETAMKLNLHGDFTYTQESFIDLANKHVRMVEVPLKVRGRRRHGTSRVASSLWRYGVRSGAIILRALRDTRPLQMFGCLAIILFALGVFLGGFRHLCFREDSSRRGFSIVVRRSRTT